MRELQPSMSPDQLDNQPGISLQRGDSSQRSLHLVHLPSKAPVLSPETIDALHTCLFK